MIHIGLLFGIEICKTPTLPSSLNLHHPLFKTNKFHRVISDSSVGSSKEPPLSEMNIKKIPKLIFHYKNFFSQQNFILLLIDKILTKILSESFWNSSQFIQCHLKIFIQKLNYHLSKAVNQSFIFMIIKLQKKLNPILMTLLFLLYTQKTFKKFISFDQT